MTERSLIPLCRLDELDDPGSRGLQISWQGRKYEILVVRSGDALYAYLNSCPHTGAPLDWMPDQFLSADQRHIQCAMHAALFRIEDGTCVAGPCVGDALKPIPARLEHGVLQFCPEQFREPGNGR